MRSTFAWIFVLAATVFAAALSGCDTVDPPAFEEEIVVEGYLEAGQPVGYVTVSRTLPVNETYDPAVQGVPGASVRIELLENDGNGVEASWDLFAPEPASGRYRTREVVDVLPLRTYRLVVDVPGTGTVTSETTVPALFRFVDNEERTFVYDADEAPLFEITEPFYPGRQSIFLITTVSLEPDTTNLTPFADAIGEDLFTLRETVSPPLNGENFDRTPSGGMHIRYPWIGLAFYGLNEMRIQAIDDNVFDFVRSNSVQQGGQGGGSTLAPGEVPNVIDHVEGGRGLFGSFATASIRFRVLPNPDR